MFHAEGIPSIGYSTYELKKQLTVHPSPALSISHTILENEFFKITVDPDSGWIKSIIDKRNGKEILSGYGNKLQLLEDKPKAWGSLERRFDGGRISTKLRSIEIAEQEPVRVVLRIQRDYLQPGIQKDFPTEDFPVIIFHAGYHTLCGD